MRLEEAKLPISWLEYSSCDVSLRMACEIFLFEAGWMRFERVTQIMIFISHSVADTFFLVFLQVILIRAFFFSIVCFFFLPIARFPDYSGGFSFICFPSEFSEDWVLEIKNFSFVTFAVYSQTSRWMIFLESVEYFQLKNLLSEQAKIVFFSF